MTIVSVTEFRKNLQKYLSKVLKGQTVRLTRRGQVIALLAPSVDIEEQAKQKLMAFRSSAKVGDVVSPIDEPWEAERATS